MQNSREYGKIPVSKLNSRFKKEFSMNYSTNPTPLSTDISMRAVWTFVIIVAALITLLVIGSKVSEGIIQEAEVHSYIQRMEDDNLEDQIVPAIEIQSASSQSVVWGNLFMVRYTYILNGKLQKTVYCTKGPDNPLFCSPYPPRVN